MAAPTAFLCHSSADKALVVDRLAMDLRANGVEVWYDKWEISPDYGTYTFFLNKNAKWHDGRPITASDVEYMIKRGQTLVGDENVDMLEVNGVPEVLGRPIVALLHDMPFQKHCAA